MAMRFACTMVHTRSGRGTAYPWKSSRLLKKSDLCFDRLSTNGKSPTILSLLPFALSLSKGERRVFQHPVKRCSSPMLGLCLFGLLDDLFYQVVRHFFVVRELHVERAATAGHRT